VRLHDREWGWQAQDPDPFIAAKMGAANTPAYRGTAYVVFEELPLAAYGNRLPQLSFEVFRPLVDPDTVEGLICAVTMIPASGEFTYSTEGIRKGSGGTTGHENLNALPDESDMFVALDRLQASAPKLESVSLVVAWFGTDLRAGVCTIKPGVEVSEKSTTPRNWSVNGVSRADAHLVSRTDEDRPVYGGTPADFAVVQAIQEMKARGLRVTFYPFLLMDVAPGNTLPNPYLDNASEAGQPAFPWRGRITCSPAAGYAGTVDKTTAAATQVAALFGNAQISSFAVSGESVSWTGSPGDWGLKRMVLHYAHLCKAAGGVDAFLIDSEMRGLTTIRSGASTYPAVQALRALAADVRTILGASTKISYAADWSEYFGHQPPDGSSDVYFHLDPLWAEDTIDFIGIDNYMPLSDWRDGFEHLDARQGWPAITDRSYLQANIAGGEGFDWFYASAADRAAQVRTRITDGAYEKPWVFRYKDLRSWWANRHIDRPGGWSAGRRRRGCRNRNRSALPSLAVPPSTAAPTSPTSSSTRSYRRALSLISPAAGATMRSNELISRRRICSGARRRTTRPQSFTANGWSRWENARPGRGMRGPTRSFPRWMASGPTDRTGGSATG
jgi:hypothetical protein